MLKKIIASGCVLGLVVHFSILVIDSGFFRDVSNDKLESCQEVIGMDGPEDFVFEKKTQTLFVSSDERLNGNLLSPKNGAIFSFDPVSFEKKNLTPSLPFDFHPHGIDLWESATETLIYAVNHQQEASMIEVFSWSGSELTHVKTIRGHILINPNDIAVIGKDKFYVSHDHGSKNALLKKIEAYSRIGRGFVSFYENGSFSVKASSISYANGMVVTPDKKRLYLASMLGKKILVFGRSSNGDLKELNAIKLDVGPDNLSMDEEGALLVAGHSKLLKLQSHMKDHTKTAPVEVYRIAGLEGDPIITRILAGDGQETSGVSVAFPAKGKILLGTIFTPKLFVCSKP
jgi:arylesterase/paraoxonase